MDNVRLDKIFLEDADGLSQLLDMINKDEGLKDTFSGGANTIGRIMNANYVAFVKDLNTTVGFVMITTNEKTGIKELDMGILDHYRNQGYGTKTLELLKQIIIQNKVNLEVQIQNFNEFAIKAVLKNGFTLLRQDELYSYYTVDINEAYQK